MPHVGHHGIHPGRIWGRGRRTRITAVDKMFEQMIARCACWRDLYKEAGLDLRGVRYAESGTVPEMEKLVWGEEGRKKVPQEQKTAVLRRMLRSFIEAEGVRVIRRDRFAGLCLDAAQRGDILEEEER